MGSLSMVAQSVGGALIGADADFSAVSTDTRTLGPGELFFALRGERFDAATFVAEAARRGAAGAVVERRQKADIPQVEVEDTRRALGDLARAWRQRFSMPVIGVTGSNGKTTVKEMIASILRAWAGRADAILATTGNLNNEIGLPLMVLRLRPGHTAAVLEMGASRAGDIAYLAGIAAPGIGLVNNAAPAHLEGFGSVAGVALAKGEMFSSLPADGIAIVNADDPSLPAWEPLIGDRARRYFGLSPSADYTATDVREENSADGPVLAFRLACPVGECEVRLPMLGRHNVRNALAAAAAAMGAGASLEHVRDGLAGTGNVGGRLRRLSSPEGAEVFDDSYNANPASVRAAIDFLSARSGRRWLVLGDMAELGPDSLALHGEIGRHARAAGIDRLFCIGAHSRAAAESFGAGAEWFADRDALVTALSGRITAGTAILVKGSRCMGLERVVAALTEPSGGAGR